MKLLFLSATILAGLSAPSWALINEIAIDATSNSGSVGSLSIIQDDANLGNLVSGSGGSGNQLPVKGPWHSISINQQAGNNTFKGSIKANASSTAASLTASYSGAGNTHSLTIGSTTAPVDPTVSITVAGASNTITDVLNGTGLSYTLAVPGASNTIHNTATGMGLVTLNETVGGSTNDIHNTLSGGGAGSITQNIQGTGNTLNTVLDGGTGQSSTLNVDSTSYVNYTQHSSGIGTSSNVSLYSTIGAASAQAVVNLTQTAAAVGASATLSVYGSTYTMGSTSTVAGTLTGGVNVYQNSSGAVLNASVTANANGYTASFTQ